MTDISQCTVVILAAQRAGVVNPLAERAGVSHKCLVPICGKPLIVHVLDVVADIPEVTTVRVSVEPDANRELEPLLAPYRENGMAVGTVASSTNIVDSVIAAVAGLDGPYLVTTADNVLMSRESFETTLAALAGHDVAMNLATKSAVLDVAANAQRRFYEFRDGGYANCNLYGIADRNALKAAEIFREGGQFMKNPGRLLTAFGIINIALFRLKLLTLDAAARRIGRKFGLRFKAIVPADGSQAVDVDNARTYDVAEMVLKQRAS